MLKPSYKIQRQLSTGDKTPTDLYIYAERCERVYQQLTDANRAKALADRYFEERATATTMTTTTTSKPHVRAPATPAAATGADRPRLSEAERARPMAEGRCFACKENGHIDMNGQCTSQWKPMGSLGDWVQRRWWPPVSYGRTEIGAHEENEEGLSLIIVEDYL
ncbi:hypothetical protein MMC07_007998 [Pseudocyphellaria aurata]|nr:hypothetical protein [Pseudocyphellaria aurata]